MQLEISGIRFFLRTPSLLTVRQPSPEYAQFLDASAHACVDTTVEVGLEINGFPDTRGMREVLRGDQSWSMFVQDDRYFLEWRTPDLHEPFQTVRFDRAGSSITVYCSEASLLRDVSGTSLINPLRYPIDQILLMYLLSRRQGAIVHAAGMVMRDRAFVFPGRSGAGKSTLSRLLRHRDAVTMLSDDRIVLRKADGGYLGFGTPWPGDEGIAENRSACLRGIFFIRQGPGNSIAALTPGEALKRLMPVTSIPWHDEETLTRILSFCGELVQDVPAYELCFAPEPGVGDLLEEFLDRPVTEPA